MATLQPYKKYNVIVYDYASQLPVGWQLLPNIALFEERRERPKNEMELLSVSISKGVVRQSDMDKKDISSQDKSNYKVVRIDDIAYGMEFRKGAVGFSIYEGIVSPVYTVLKPRKGKSVNPKFFHYVLRTEYYKNYIWRNVYGIGEHFLPCRFTHFKRMYSIVPPLEVQNNIVAYLDKKNNEIDKFIRNKERLIELLEEQRKEMIDETLSSFENIEINKKPLKYLIRLVSDLTPNLSQDETYLALENIESWTGKIDLSIGQGEFESTVKKFKHTDVLFSKLRPYLAKVVIPEFNGVCVSEILVFRPSKLIYKEFLFYKLISRRFIDFVDTSTYGSKMPRASYNFIGKIEIEYPSEIIEQKRIVREIKQQEAQIERLKNKYRKEISSIKEYREALITDLVTGKRSVPQK